MSSKRELFKGKNKELSEKRRPPLHYVDFKDLLVFTPEDLDKELEKLPELKLRKDDDSVLHRRNSQGRLTMTQPAVDLIVIVVQVNSIQWRRRSRCIPYPRSPLAPKVQLTQLGS